MQTIKNEKDIIIKLDGRMGNQMFQWALARAIEQKTGIMPLIDNSKETLKLNHFQLTKDLKTIKKPLLNRVLRKIILIRNLRNKMTELKFDMPQYKEEVFNKFQSEFLEIATPAYLQGYFQTEKYFNEIRSQLLKDFELTTNLNSANKKLLEQIKSTESVSLHFRRGDYLKARVAKHFGNITEQYYHDAIEEIAKKTGKNLVLYVFSDDINWVRNNVKFAFETVYVDINSAKQGYFDIELMKNCKHNIIANSSFSWWGAWLNENPQKIVVAPSPERPNQKDYDKYPDEWVKCDPHFKEV